MKKYISFLAAVLFLFTMSACGGEEVNKEIELETESESTLQYELVAVEYGDVIESVTVSLKYVTDEEEEYSFDLKNATCETVYVKKGDRVKKGDVLAVLKTETVESTLEEYDYQLSVLELNLQHTIENRDFALNRAEVLYENYTYRTDDDKDAYEEEVESINKQYATQIQNLEDQIEILKLRIEDANQEYKDSRIVARADGIVSYCKSTLEGSLITPGEVVITTYDEDKCLFKANDNKGMAYFEEDMTYTLTVGTGSAQKVYEVMPANYSQWYMVLCFKPVGDYATLSLGDLGKITLSTGERTGVLVIPADALHTSGENYFVYYLDDEGVRRMKYITVGMIGTDYVEILDGLEEGEFIILE